MLDGEEKGKKPATHSLVRLMSSLYRSGTSLVTIMCVSFGSARSSVAVP